MHNGLSKHVLPIVLLLYLMLSFLCFIMNYAFSISDITCMGDYLAVLLPLSTSC